MAIFKDTEKRKTSNYKKTQNIASLKRVNEYVSRGDKVAIGEELTIEELSNRKDDAVFGYVMQDKKTETKLITGINCRPSSVFEEMLLTKSMFRKMEGRQFKHFIHAYSKLEKSLTPKMAHEITLKLLEHKKFKDYEILVATHTDTDHIHSHIIVNSVNMKTGKKWNHSLKDMTAIRELSNKLCAEYGLKHSFANIKPNELVNKKPYPGDEYRAKQKGRSWKYETFLMVDECRRRAKNKDEFIKTLEKVGYKVRWVDSRKNITFILPNGRKLNNDKLHPKQRFTKEALLKQFQINKEFHQKIKINNIPEIYYRTIKLLTDNPEKGDKSYPMTYLEGQALKEKMIEEAKGRGFDWEKEQERQ